MSTNRSFAARLSATIVGVINLLFIVAAFFSFAMSYKMVGREAVTIAQAELDKAILETENTLGQAEAMMQTLAFVVGRNQTDTAYLYSVVRGVTDSSPLVVGSSISFAPDYFEGHHFFAPYAYKDTQTGQIMTKQLGNDDYDYFTMEWYRVPAASGEPIWSEPYFDDGGGNVIMSTYSVPVKDAEGNVYAILTVDLSLEWLQQKLEAIRPYEHSFTLLVGRTGTYVSHRDKERIMSETIFTRAQEEGDEEALSFGRAMVNGESGYVKFRKGRQYTFAVYGPLNNGWSAAIVCPVSDVLKDLNRLTNFFVLLSIIGVLLVYYIVKRIIRRESQPITEFTYSALSMAKGNFHTHIPEVKTKDELLRLRNSLSYMQQSVDSYLSELRTTTAANERFESELNVARDIQLGMLPRNFPQRADVSLYADLRPAKEVGGDLYDFVVKEDVLYFTIGDVSGKGVPAALFMAICRSAVRFVSGLGLTMAECVEKVNAIMCDGNENGLFVTLFVARLDLRTGEMRYCNAGHNPIVVIPPTGEPYFLRAKANLAVGLITPFNYQGEELTLAPGTRLVLYTDGVTEAENAGKALYGDDRLLAFAASVGDDDSDSAVVENLYASVKTFAGDNEQNDDITLLSIQYRGPENK